MRILLINMPWAPINVPSLALGLLTSVASARLPEAEVEVVHANLDYVDWIVDHAEFEADDYHFFSLLTYFSGFGEWVFSSALNRDPDWRVGEFTAQAKTERTSERQLALAVRLHRLAPEFIAEVAARIVERSPDLVGFTSAFQQNAAALATAAHLKRLNPEIKVVFGGSNCDGEQGAAIHRNFPAVDFVVRGEGEVAFPQLVELLSTPDFREDPVGDDPSPLASISGLCWTDRDGNAVANPISPTPVPISQIPAPDYGGYFERLAASRAQTWVEPKLIVEGSRGCWWGAKHQCAFCGLNGSVMRFRSKHPDQFYQEIVDLVERHQVLDMYVVDNILDMRYTTSLLPRLADSGYDLRLQYEIKANLKATQVRSLAEAGVVSAQPGIENLNGHVLTIMSKGVTGCQNVRMLRDAETNGITIAWNYLYGLPGETDEDYQTILDQMPALAHLGPPSGGTRIALERFSPFFDRPELGFTDPRPAGHYRLIYDLPDSELMDLGYVFAVSPRGIGELMVSRLDQAIATWRDSYASSRLTYDDLGDQIVLVSDRPGFEWRVLALTDPEEIRAFRALDQPQTVASLARRSHLEPAATDALLQRWREAGIVFADGGQFIQIAPQSTNQSMLRIDYLRGVREPEPEPDQSTDHAERTAALVAG